MNKIFSQEPNDWAFHGFALALSWPKLNSNSFFKKINEHQSSNLTDFHILVASDAPYPFGLSLRVFGKSNNKEIRDFCVILQRIPDEPAPPDILEATNKHKGIDGLWRIVEEFLTVSNQIDKIISAKLTVFTDSENLKFPPPQLGASNFGKKIKDLEFRSTTIEFGMKSNDASKIALSSYTDGSAIFVEIQDSITFQNGADLLEDTAIKLLHNSKEIFYSWNNEKN
jgi:hypothetical protein